MKELKERYKFDWNRILNNDALHIEYSITDVCNRSCKSCSHLAPLAKETNHVSIEEFERITEILHKCLPDIHTFWLTGGEPTLHPRFKRLLEIAREIYTKSYIGIYTNGMTLNKNEKDETFWKFTRDNGIVWGITIYEGDIEYYETLFKGHDCGNNLAIVRTGRWFANLTNYSRGESISQEKYKSCGWERCKVNVRNGRIYNCPSSEFADLFNGYFGEKLEITPKDYLIIDKNLTRDGIEQFRNPMPFCSQCKIENRYTKNFANAQSRKEMKEWAEVDSFRNGNEEKINRENPEIKNEGEKI